MFCGLGGLSVIADEKINSSQPCVSSRNWSAYYFKWFFPWFYVIAFYAHISTQLKLEQVLCVALLFLVFCHSNYSCTRLCEFWFWFINRMRFLDFICISLHAQGSLLLFPLPQRSKPYLTCCHTWENHYFTHSIQFSSEIWDSAVPGTPLQLEPKDFPLNLLCFLFFFLLFTNTYDYDYDR